MSLRKMISYAKKNPLLALLFALSITYLCIMTAYFTVLALNSAIYMNTYAANGTFQLYNPLLRLAEGQVIAKDFPFFHGIGIPLLHYPLFALMGHGVFAAEFVKIFISTAAFLVSTVLFFYAYFKNIQKAVIASSIFTILAIYCVDVVYPGNSLVGLRSTMPIIAAAFMLWRPIWRITIKGIAIPLYYPILTILLGLGVACGTEQGLAAAVAFSLVELFFYTQGRYTISQWWWRYLVKILLIVTATYIVLFILTLGHANEALHYALIDVAKDQGWYFGAPPNDFLAPSTIHYLFGESVIPFAPFMLAGLLLTLYLVLRKHTAERQNYTIYFLIIYGLVVFAVSITGYWAPGAQLIPLNRVLSMLLIAHITSCIFYLITTYTKRDSRIVYKILAIIPSTVLMGYVVSSAVDHIKIARDLDPITTIRHARIARHVADDSYISVAWQKRFAAFRPYIKPGETIWDTYGSIYSTTLGKRVGPRGGEDYIIHALGETRRDQYAQDFISSRAQFVTTLKPSYFLYEEWLWMRHWDFYRHLLTHYEIIADNDSHILWKRLPNTDRDIATAPIQSIKKSDGSYVMHINPSDSLRILEATIHYTPRNDIPAVSSKLSRYLISITGSSAQRFPISLPPYSSTWKFPITVMPGDTEIALSPNVQGFNIGGTFISINSLSINEVRTIPSRNMFMIYDNYCSFGGNYNYKDTLGGQYKNLRCKAEELPLQYYLSSRQIQN